MTECVHIHARHAKDSDVAKFYRDLTKKREAGKAAAAAPSKMPPPLRQHGIRKCGIRRFGSCLRLALVDYESGKHWNPGVHTQIQHQDRPAHQDDLKLGVRVCQFHQGQRG